MEELPFDPRYGWGDLGMWAWWFQVGVGLARPWRPSEESVMAWVPLMWPPWPTHSALLPSPAGTGGLSAPESSWPWAGVSYMGGRGRERGRAGPVCP